MDFKNFSIELKTDADARTVEGLGSVFHNTDQGGDIVLPGAFTKSLSRRSPAMLWQHKQDQPVGVWDEVRETAEGLYVKGRILNTALGNDAYELAKHGAIKGMSIGYGTKDSVTDRKTGVRQLKELELFEVSLVTFPMNERANIMRVKNHDGADVDKAAEWLKKSIDLHQRHMDGTEPTTGAAGDRSQMRMMDMMKKAYGFLTADAAEDGMAGMKFKPADERALEEYLREAGYSRTEAKAIVARGHKGLDQREAGDNAERFLNLLHQFNA